MAEEFLAAFLGLNTALLLYVVREVAELKREVGEMRSALKAMGLIDPPSKEGENGNRGEG